MTKSKTQDINTNTNSIAAALDFANNLPEAKARGGNGNCDFSVAVRMLTEFMPQVKRPLTCQQMYLCIQKMGYTGTAKAVCDAAWKLAGNLTPAQQKAGQKPVKVLTKVAKGVYQAIEE